MLSSTIYLDLTMERIQNIKCSLGDNKTRDISIILTNNGKNYTISNATKIYLKVHKPNNTYLYIDETDDNFYRSGNIIHLIITDSLTNVSGVSICEIELIKDGTTISTCKFNISVEKSSIANDVVVATNEFTALSNLMAYFSNITTNGTSDSINVSIQGDIDLAKQYMEQSKNYSVSAQDYYNKTSALFEEGSSSSGSTTDDVELDFETENISFSALLG